MEKIESRTTHVCFPESQNTVPPLAPCARSVCFKRKEDTYADTLACRETGVGRPADRHTDTTGLYRLGWTVRQTAMLKIHISVSLPQIYL